MKIKELQKSLNIAWSPQDQIPITLATGTAAQQILDISTNSPNPSLDLYSLNLSDPGYDLSLLGTQQSAHKFHKIVWSPYDNTVNYPNGIIVCGCEDGIMKIYNVCKILSGQDGLVSESNKHNGPVRSIDYNPFKSNLIASAASESEIFIWDINNTSVPMTPGTKSQPFEDVCGIAWNRQVQHILASAFVNKCVIWDLRKNEPIIKLSDSQSRVRWRVVQWHPDVATQLWLASEDDSAPFIQLWDLRYATAPSKTFQMHSRGVLGMTWCSNDSSLMMSCGKDNKILCWDANSENTNGEILSEIASTSQWYSDISWCPRNPAIVAASSFDSLVSIYSIFGGSQQQVETASKIADSFPGMENIPQENIIHQAGMHSKIFHDLKRPPKWMKRPSGISFGFGGKMIVYGSNNKTVEIKQLITDKNLVKKSAELKNVLIEGNYSKYCLQRANESNDQHSRYIWLFLRAYFEANTKVEFLRLLGYELDNVSKQIERISVSKNDDRSNDKSDDVDQDIADIVKKQSFNGSNSDEPMPNVPFKLITSGAEGLICEAILTGDISAAVELCMNAGRSTDAIILASLGGSDILARTQYRYLKENKSFLSNLISAMVLADWSGVISQCTIDSWKEALVAALTHSQDQSPLLCERLGERLQIESDGDESVAKNSLFCYICAGKIERIVDAWSEIHGALKTEDSEKVQELVEVVIILSKALESKGEAVCVDGKYAELLSKYAQLLVAQGSLDTALSYIGTSENDLNIVELRERLYFALGHKHQETYNPQTNSGLHQNNFKNNTLHYHPQRTSSLSSHSEMMMQPQQSQGSFNTTSFTKPGLVNLFENIPHPPRPSSVSSVGSASQTSSLPKPKRLLDPSVQSGSFYGQVPLQSTSLLNQQVSAISPQQNNSLQSTIGWDQQNYGNANNTNLTSSSVFPPKEVNSIIKNPTPPGWNDPPEFKSKPVAKKEILPSAPITHPIFGIADQQQNAPEIDQNHLQNFNNQQFGMHQNNMPPVINHLEPQQNFYREQQPVLHPKNDLQSFQVPQPQPQQQGSSASPLSQLSQQEMYKQKPPLPEEYIYLQTVFDELKTNCVTAAGNPQTKRKLDDVSKRLEILYDFLREHRLSSSTLESLNKLVQLIQIGDYGNGLGVHTQMVSGPDFSKISGFMPGIKILLQLAMQLHVYLR